MRLSGLSTHRHGHQNDWGGGPEVRQGTQLAPMRGGQPQRAFAPRASSHRHGAMAWWLSSRRCSTELKALAVAPTPDKAASLSLRMPLPKQLPTSFSSHISSKRPPRSDNRIRIGALSYRGDRIRYGSRPCQYGRGRLGDTSRAPGPRARRALLESSPWAATHGPTGRGSLRPAPRVCRIRRRPIVVDAVFTSRAFEISR